MRAGALTLIAAALALGAGAPAQAAVRVKDITDLEGARSNYLYGVGLVVGLNGTGSKSNSTLRMATDMLAKLSVNTPRLQDFKSGNISMVAVTAEIGPWARKGTKLDVTVSVLDDATSLLGGTLMLTPLSGADGVVYVVAQGAVSVGGFRFRGEAASAQQNVPSVGRVVGGGLVECEAPGKILCNGALHILLRDPDFVTAPAIARAINERFPFTAMTLDAGRVAVAVPPDWLHDPITFAGEIGLLEVNPDVPARVVFNERTGTIVVGQNVKVATVAIQHGNLNILTTESPQVSQPLPFSRGRTTVVPRTDLNVTPQQGGGLHVVRGTVTVNELARALNALGASPMDIIAIFQALKQAGALHAELIKM